MPSAYLLDLFHIGRGKGNTSTLIAALTALKRGLLVTADHQRAQDAIRAGVPAGNVVSFGERLRGWFIDGPVLLDPEILPKIVEEWERDLERLKRDHAEQTADLRAKLRAAEEETLAVRGSLRAERLMFAAESGRDIRHLPNADGAVLYADWQRDYSEPGIVWRSGGYEVRRSTELRGWIVTLNGARVTQPSPYALFAIHEAIAHKERTP